MTTTPTIVQHVAVSVGSVLEAGFRANLRRRIDTGVAGLRVNVGVRADISAADRAAFRAATRTALAGLRADVGVKASVSAADKAALKTSVKAALKGVDAKIRVKLELDPSSVAAFRAAVAHETRNRVINVSYRQTGPAPSPPSGRGPGPSPAGGGGVGGIYNDTRLAVLLLQHFGTVIPTALAPAAAAVGAFAASLAAAGFAVGAFGTVAAGHFVQVRDAAEQAKEGLPIEKDFQGVLTGLDRLKVSYSGVLETTREPVLNLFTDGINLASAALPRFVPLVKATAGALRGVVAQVYEFAEGEAFTAFLRGAETSGPRALQSLTGSLLNATEGILGVLEAFRSTEGSVLGGLNRMTAAFAKWGQGLKGSSGFKDFLEYVKNAGPTILSTIQNLAGAVAHVGVAAAPVGQAVSKLVSGFASIVNAVPTPVLTGLIATFTAVRLATLASTVGMAVWRAATIASTAATIAMSSRTAFAAVTLTALTGSAARAGAVMTFVSARMAQLSAATTLSARAAIIASGAFATLRVAMVALTRATIVMGLVGLAATALFGLIDKLTGAKKRDAEATKAYVTTGISLARTYREQGEAAATAAAAQEVAGDETGRATARLQQFVAIGGQANDFYLAMSGNAAAAGRSANVFNTAIEQTNQRLAALRALQALPAAQRDKTSAEIQKEIDKEEEHKRSLEANRDQLQATASSAAQYAATILLGAGATEQATESLRQFILAGNEAYQQFQTRLDAQTTGYEKVADAVISAHETWQESIRATVRSQRSLERTIDDTARAEERAADAVVDAQARVKDAYREAREAQEALTRAREEAARQLRDQVDSEEAAQIRLLQARLDAQAYTGEPIDRAAVEADIARRQALLDLKNAQEDYNDTRQEGTKLREQGVENSPGVVAAREAAARAERSYRDAINEVREAQASYTRTLAEGREAREEARHAVDQARVSQERAKAAYDDTTMAAGYQIDTAKSLKKTLDDLVGTYIEELKLVGGPETEAGLKVVRVNIEALRLAAEHPDWSAAQAWGEAERTILAPAVGSYNRPSPNSYNSNVQDRPSGSKQKAYAAGGAVWGLGTETSDSIDAKLSLGEHVWTAKEVRAAGGHGMVEALRKAVMREDRGMPRFAGGGAVHGPYADISKSNLAQKMIDKGVIDKARSAIQNFFVGEVGGVDVAGGPNVKGQDAGIWRALRGVLEARFPSMKDRDFGGYVNRLTATGNVSYHAYGKALDIMKHSMEVFNWIKANYGAQTHELIYSPAGEGQLYKGKPHNYSGVTRAMHYNHIHWSMQNPPGGGAGGVVPGAPTVGLRPDQLKEAFLKGQPAGAPAVGGNLGAWMNAAIGYAGVPASWIGGPGVPGLYTLIMRESGGNPRAINKWDSNAAKGQASRGLMQTIPSTFAAYRDKRLPADIFDPISNIVAGLNYIKSRYKSIFNVQQADPNKAPKGYRAGGAVELGLADNGGTLEHGKAVLNLSGKPETVRSADQEDRLREQLAELVRLANSPVTLDTMTLNRLAQAISTRPAQLAVDGRVIAETAFERLEF